LLENIGRVIFVLPFYSAFLPKGQAAPVRAVAGSILRRG